MAGNREKDWGKEKVFREGQAKQRLDDLFFDYIKLAKKLQPKVVIAENVKGMLQGNAKTYVKRVKDEFEKAGYKVQLFLLNAASMGVPQKRERVFFICQRNDLNFSKLELKFNEESIKLGEFIDSSKGLNLSKDGKLYSDWLQRIETDKNFGDICLRTEKKQKSFGRVLIKKNDYAPTIVSGNQYIYFDEFKEISNQDIQQIGSYPLDYNFKKIEPKYLIGMSVPPVMTAQVATEIYNQWFK
jgi:DNA (cytosine-5)-methyltransferase 1